MANPFYSTSGNPGFHTNGISALLRAEFAAIAAGFDLVPQIITTGSFTTTFNQVGNNSYTLPISSGTLALIADVSAEATARTAGDAANATAIASEVTARTAAVAANTTAIGANTTAIGANATAITVETTARTAADTAEVTARNAAIATETTARNAAIAVEVAARVAADAIPTAGFLSGLGLSNEIGMPLSVLDIAAGSAADSANATKIMLASAMTKSVASSWVAGTGNGCMGVGITFAPDTAYHVYLATIGGNTDVFLDYAFPPTHAPGVTTASRRIGTIFGDGAGHIRPFSQNGDEMLFITPVTISAALPVLSASRVLQALSVGVGVKVNALVRFEATNPSAAWAISINSPEETDAAVTVPTVQGALGESVSGLLNVRTDTSRQISLRATAGSGATTTIAITHLGYIDIRGRG